jgi:hypothetical protein
MFGLSTRHSISVKIVEVKCRLSSVVEHVHGKDGVVSSSLTGGSIYETNIYWYNNEQETVSKY